MRMAAKSSPSVRPAPSIPPIMSAGTQMTEPIQTKAMDIQLCRSSGLISNPLCFFISFPPVNRCGAARGGADALL